ncbi:MAG TPA: hypothetical protein VIJ12_02490, partial [Candidatus Baltobacteraceae bacterium]
MKLTEALPFLSAARQRAGASHAVAALPVAFYIVAIAALPFALVVIGGILHFTPFNALPPALVLLAAEAVLLSIGWRYVEPLIELLVAGLLGHAHDGSWLHTRAGGATPAAVWPAAAIATAAVVTLPLLLLASVVE